MIKVELSIETLEDLLKPVMRQVPFIVSKSINDTLFGARKNQLKMMERDIDGGPTRWTKNGLIYDKATKSNLSGSLYFKGDRPYMKKIIEGAKVYPHPGNRRLIAPVKDKIKVNKYGNLARDKIHQLEKKRNHFVGNPGGKKDSSSYGVYKITGRGKSKKVTKVMHLNLTSREQRITYQGPAFAKKYIESNLRLNIIRAAKRAIQTAR